VFCPSWVLFFQKASNLTFQEGICQNKRTEEKQMEFEGNELDVFFALKACFL
jgi:hypothetical protein